MIDELMETVKQAEQKAGWMPPLMPERPDSEPDRLSRFHDALFRVKHDSTLTNSFLGRLSCYVPDSVWDYCLNEALKPLEGAK